MTLSLTDLSIVPAGQEQASLLLATMEDSGSVALDLLRQVVPCMMKVICWKTSGESTLDSPGVAPRNTTGAQSAFGGAAVRGLAQYRRLAHMAGLTQGRRPLLYYFIYLGSSFMPNFTKWSKSLSFFQCSDRIFLKP